MLFLNRANKFKGKARISTGGISGTYVDVKSVFARALQHKASGIILCHNHPSGQLRPSEADKAITQKMIDAGRLLDIKVWDHLIIGDRNYYSFADEGFM